MYGKGFLRARGTSPLVIRIETLTTAMKECDPTLEGHAARVGAHADAVARRLGWNGERLAELRLGAALHDVGKVNVRGEVLTKAGRLDEGEIAAIRAHPVEGAWLIAGLHPLAAALPYVLFHHERWDGAGYPTRRAGREIPIEGRVLAVADAFDAMTSTRAYRAAQELGWAVGEVERCAGTQFDPDVAGAFRDAFDAGEISIEQPVATVAALG
jgi:HD-GYP domain-containing protein (c-di-GMP phosphodiesterase class II)